MIKKSRKRSKKFKNSKAKKGNQKSLNKIKTVKEIKVVNRVTINNDTCPFCKGNLIISKVLCPDSITLECFECTKCHIYMYESHDYKILKKISEAYNKNINYEKVYVVSKSINSHILHKNRVIIVRNEKNSKLSSQKLQIKKDLQVKNIIPESKISKPNRTEKNLNIKTASPTFYLSVNDYFYASRLKRKLTAFSKMYDKIEIKLGDGEVISSNVCISLCDTYINNSYGIFENLYEFYSVNQFDKGLETFALMNNIVLNNHWFNELHKISKKSNDKELYDSLMDKLIHLLEREHYILLTYNCSAGVRKIVNAKIILYNKKIENKINILDWTKTSPTIYVYEGFIDIYVRNNSVFDYGANVKVIGSDNIIQIVVTYCPQQNKYYIPYQLVKKYIDKHVSLNLKMVPVDNFSTSFNEFSILSLYGYNAKQGGMSESRRRAILSTILDNKIMSGGQIISHLSGLISLRENRKDRDFSHAIGIWKSDIKFVNDYIVRNKDIPRVDIYL